MKKIIYIIPIIVFFTIQSLKAQVLFNEDFDSYPAGDLNTDYTGTTIGQGGWFVLRGTNNTGTAIVTAESGKGNVLSLVSNGIGFSEQFRFKQDDGVIDALWNNRSTSNNICKLEFDFFGSNNYNTYCAVFNMDNGLLGTGFITFANKIGYSYWEAGAVKEISLKYYNSTNPFPSDLWIKVEMFIDYNTNNVYVYIPTLNMQSTSSFTHNNFPDNIGFGGMGLSSASVAKFDNIKLSAIQSLPLYILSTTEQLAAKFNIYPNPATNVVNITNNENMLVNQVSIYDIAGKQLSTQSFNHEAEIRLNVENLASGTYMLHLKTSEGTVVKKLIKK